MVENGINQTSEVHLDHKEGLRFAQWGLMRRYDDPPCPNPDWKQTNPQNQQYKSWLEKLGEKQCFSPVFGLKDIEEPPTSSG